MAVIVDMEMPQSCHFCDLSICKYNNTFWGDTKTDYRSDRHPDCPLKEVPNGKWIENDKGALICSECHTWFENDRKEFMLFCPYCGAKMEQKGEQGCEQ